MIKVADLLAVIQLQDQMSPAVQQATVALNKLGNDSTLMAAQVHAIGKKMGDVGFTISATGVNANKTAAELEK